MRLTECRRLDRKSTRLNSSHLVISYAVFCLKKKKRPARRSALRRIRARRPQRQRDRRTADAPAAARPAASCFVNSAATTEIYTLALHDALPILPNADG